MAELEIELLRTKERVRVLEEVVKQQSEALKEGSRLLVKCRPSRPPIPHDKKLLVAAEQGWKCADPFGDCIMWKLSDGTFSHAGGLFECDHVEPWNASYRSTGNLQALCSACHHAKCRIERVHALEESEKEHDGEGSG